MKRALFICIIISLFAAILTQECRTQPQEERKMIPESLYLYNPKDQKELEILIKYLKDHEDSNYRQVAAQVIGRKGGKEVIPHLKEALKDKDKAVQRIAAESLLRFDIKELAYNNLKRLAKEGDSRALQPLIVYSTKDKKRVIRDKEAENILYEAINYENEEVQSLAILSLVEIGEATEEFISRLSKILKESQNEVALTYTIKSLEKIGSEKAINILKTTPKHENKNINKMIIETLKRVEEKHK